MRDKCKQPIGLCMIGRWTAALGIACALVMLGGCATAPPEPLVFDASLPAEQSSRIYFYNVEVTKYGEFSVPHKNFRGKIISEWRYVYLPPGDMVLNVIVTEVNPSPSYENYGNGGVLRYTFEPDTDYVVSYTNTLYRGWSTMKGGESAVLIHKMTYEEFLALRKDHRALVDAADVAELTSM